MGRRLAALALFGLVPALLAGTGCVSSDDIEGLHRQMSDIERQIHALESKSSSKEEVQKVNASVSQQTSQLLKSNADTGAKLDELFRQIEGLQAKLDDTSRRLAELSQQIAASQSDTHAVNAPPNPSSMTGVGSPRPNAVPTPPVSGMPAVAVPPKIAPGGGGPSPQQLYDTAYGDYTKGRYELSIAGFQEYIERFPSTDLTDNAQYWIGEANYSEKKFDQAIREFDTLLRRWPQSDKASGALLKKGLALSELGRKAEAVVALQYVVHEYPTSDEARIARQRLSALGADAR